MYGAEIALCDINKQQFATKIILVGCAEAMQIVWNQNKSLKIKVDKRQNYAFDLLIRIGNNLKSCIIFKILAFGRVVLYEITLNGVFLLQIWKHLHLFQKLVS
jgi:hypothetical protein